MPGCSGLLLGFLLAGNASGGFWRGMEPGGWNLNATVNALAVSAALDAGECGVNQAQFGGFTFVKCQLQIARRVDLCRGVLLRGEVFGRCFGAPYGAATQVAQLLQQAGALGEQLSFERGGELCRHEGSLCVWSFILRAAHPGVFDESQVFECNNQPPMQTLRNAHLIARFVLVWFALSIGVAIASPIVKPQGMELICTGTGVMKVLVKADDGTTKEVATKMTDCPLCATVGAPPPVTRLNAEPVQPLAYVMQSIPSAHIAALTGAPPPARGPPAFS